MYKRQDQIKQLRIYPPEKGNCKIIVVYEVPYQEELPQNGHELAIDLGLHNLMTCYDPRDVYKRQLQWNIIEDADGYFVYGNRCNTGTKSYKYRKLATITRCV